MVINHRRFEDHLCPHSQGCWLCDYEPSFQKLTHVIRCRSHKINIFYLKHFDACRPTTLIHDTHDTVGVQILLKTGLPRLSCAFRYLYEFLYGWLVSALSRADTFLMEQEAMAESHRGRGAKKNKAKKKKTRPYGREIAMYQALQNLCGGFYKVNILLLLILLYCCIML